MPKAYSYTRFSHPSQREGDSLRRQVEKARAYAASRGLDLDESLRLLDQGRSAYHGRHLTGDAALGRFLDLVESGVVERGSYLLIENLDRLSRQAARKALRVLEDIVEAGITVVTLTGIPREYTTEHLDSTLGLMEVIFTFARAHEESAVKASRIRASWDQKRKLAREGNAMTATCPNWLTLDRKTRKYRPIPDRVKIVRRIFREALKGYGTDRIVEGLNSEGVPVFGRGRYWHHSYIVRVLDNPAVMGIFIPHKIEEREDRQVRVPQEPVHGYYPKIIPPETFHRVQSMREGLRAPLRGRHSKGVVQNILGSLARCPSCGGPLVLVAKGSKIWRYFVCSRAKVGAGCEYRSIRYEHVEEAILRSPGELLANVPAGEGADERLDRDIEEVQALLDVNADTMENLLRAVERGHTSGTLNSRIRALEAEQVELRDKLARLLGKRETSAGPLVGLKVNDLADALSRDPLDKAEVNALLRQLFSAVTVDPDAGTLTFEWQHGGTTEILYLMPGTAKARQRRPKPRKRGSAKKR